MIYKHVFFICNHLPYLFYFSLPFIFLFHMLSLASCPGRYYIAWTPVVYLLLWHLSMFIHFGSLMYAEVESENQRNDAAVEKHFQGWFIQFSVTPGCFVSFWKNKCTCPLTRKQERCSIGLELVRSLSRLGSGRALQVSQSSRLETWHGDAGPTFWIPPGPCSGLRVGDMCLCTQARCTFRFRSFAAFPVSMVLSLGLSAIGPTTLQIYQPHLRRICI